MTRLINLAVLAVLATLVSLPIASTFKNSPSPAAYAQGAFGKKTTGDTDEDQRKKDEDARRVEEQRRRDEEAKRLEEQRKGDETRRVEEQRRRDEEVRRLEGQRRRDDEARRVQDQGRRDDEARRVEEERRRGEEARKLAEERRLEEESRRLEEESRPKSDGAGPAGTPAGRTIDAGPTYSRETRRDDTGKYERVGERPRPPAHRSHRPDHYLYDPDYIIVVPEPRDPVIIYVPDPGSSRAPTRPVDPAVPDVPASPTPPATDKAVTPVETPTPPPEGIPVPTTADEALVQLRRAWMESNPRLLRPLLPEKEPIRIYDKGELVREMTPDDFYSITADAMQELKTEVFWLKSANKTDDKVAASGIHTYRGQDAVVRRSEITYTFELRAGRWVIAETGFTPAVRTKLRKSVTREEAERMLMDMAPASLVWTVPESALSLAAALALVRP